MTTFNQRKAEGLESKDSSNRPSFDADQFEQDMADRKGVPRCPGCGWPMKELGLGWWKRRQGFHSYGCFLMDTCRVYTVTTQGPFRKVPQ